MRKILVTGGSGFIGSSFIQQLLKHKIENDPDLEIRAMDLKRPEAPGVVAIQGSVLDITDLAEAAQGCDAVVHLAALLGVQKSETRRLDCLNINILGTLGVLNACVQERVKKLVFASSSEVYGDQRSLPIRETNPLSPKSVYAISKLAGEEYVRAYGRRYNIDYSILRFFSVYGPGQVGEFVVSRFIRAVQDNQPPTVYGTGEQKRAFCYVEDISKGILKALFSPKANGKILNIGNDQEPISILDLAYKVVRLSGKPELEPRLVPLTASDRTAEREIFERIPDISKAREILGYEPTCSLDYGIQKVFENGAVAPTWVR